MKSAKHGRLVAPATTIIFGAGLAAALAAAQGWEDAIPVAVIAVAGAVGYYVWGGLDSDTGAMLGQRVDERQSLLRMRAQALAAVAVAVTGVVGYIVAVALKDPVWPFVLFLGVEVVVFIAGLVIYGARRPLGNRSRARDLAGRRQPGALRR
jgi:MFS family permease